MLRVNYYYRSPVRGNHSIEGVFNNVASALDGRINANRYFTRSQVDLMSIAKVGRMKADVHHITGAVNYLAFGLPSRKTIITVHDVGFYENPVNRGMKRFVYGLFWLKLPLQKVRAITTVSEFTKTRLLEQFAIAPSKVHVIQNPISNEFQFHPRTGRGSKLRILQIGSGAHKNLRSLIFASQGLDVHLIIIGYPSKEELELIKRFSISFEQHADVVTDDLVRLYRESDILFFASLYEGFGLPILEAQQVGRPVITSSYGAMKSTAGEGAYFVCPNDIDQIRSAIQDLQNDDNKYNEIVKLGFRNVSRFSLNEIANQYFRLYESIT